MWFPQVVNGRVVYISCSIVEGRNNSPWPQQGPTTSWRHHGDHDLPHTWQTKSPSWVLEARSPCRHTHKPGMRYRWCDHVSLVAWIRSLVKMHLLVQHLFSRHVFHKNVVKALAVFRLGLTFAFLRHSWLLRHKNPNYVPDRFGNRWKINQKLPDIWTDTHKAFLAFQEK